MQVISKKSEKGHQTGFFINLYDWDTLQLYLDSGVYGFLMTPEPGDISRYSRHYAALGDYACGREGAHVFFFLKRTVVYAGQLKGSSEYGCFYLNGSQSPLNRKAEAELYWDESIRSRYRSTNREGVFRVKTRSGWKEKSQPYLILFEDKLGMKGNAITSDDLYFELGSFPYPLPTNSIQGMSFCTMTPGETSILLTLLENSEENILEETKENIELTSDPIPYTPDLGISHVSQAKNESHLEASVLANPKLLPNELKPKNSILCRQIPISPFKPAQMDRADICYFSSPSIEDGTIPNMVIELKNQKAGKGEAEQVVRYAKWIEKVVGEASQSVNYALFAPDFTRTINSYIPEKLRKSVIFYAFDGRNQTQLVS